MGEVVEEAPEDPVGEAAIIMADDGAEPPALTQVEDEELVVVVGACGTVGHGIGRAFIASYSRPVSNILPLLFPLDIII